MMRTIMILLEALLSLPSCGLFHSLYQEINSIGKEFAPNGHFQFIKGIFQRTIGI